MGNLVVLDQKSPSAVLKAVFDFTSLLGVGETISSATASSAVWTGVDASPGAILGATTTSNSQVTQTLTGGLAGVIYKVQVSATTSNGQTLVLFGYLAVNGDPL